MKKEEERAANVLKELHKAPFSAQVCQQGGFTVGLVTACR